MRNLRRAGVLAGILVVFVSGPVSSHHSHAMFDFGTEVSITGTVTDFTFRNPHGFLFVDVEEADGQVVNYWVELGPIPAMIERGIGLRTFQAGDVITVSLFPLKDGRPGGNYNTIVGSDGKTYQGRGALD